MSSSSPPISPPAIVRPHRGGMILAFGILGLLVCVIFGILAWVLGNADLREMAAGRMDRSGEGVTQAGRICGIVAVMIQLVGVALILLFVVAAAAMALLSM